MILIPTPARSQQPQTTQHKSNAEQGTITTKTVDVAEQFLMPLFYLL